MFNNVNFYIERDKKIKYKNVGRIEQDLKEAIKYDNAIKDLLEEGMVISTSTEDIINDFPYEVIDIKDKSLCKNITKILEEKLRKKIK